jgi:transcriptional regulator with XRE-family HTH domain
MKMKRYKNIDDFGRAIGLSDDEIRLVRLKTGLLREVIAQADNLGLSHTEIAKSSGLARSVVSGIINGSLQSVSLERLIRLAHALNLRVDLKVKRAS